MRKQSGNFITPAEKESFGAGQQFVLSIESHDIFDVLTRGLWRMVHLHNVIYICSVSDTEWAFHCGSSRFLQSVQCFHARRLCYYASRPFVV